MVAEVKRFSRPTAVSIRLHHHSCLKQTTGSILLLYPNPWDDVLRAIFAMANLYEISIQSIDNLKCNMLKKAPVELVAASHLFSCSIHLVLKDERRDNVLLTLYW